MRYNIFKQLLKTHLNAELRKEGICMNAMDNLFARRSIRSFTGEPLSREMINQLLKAAYAAPVGMGRYDSLHITVVTNRDYLNALQSAFASHTGRPGAQPLYGAPVLIILSSIFPGIPTDNSSYSNTAIISQNIALAATAMGVGACHIWGVIRALNTCPQLLRKLNLPEGFMPCCGVALGYTQETYTVREIAKDRIMTAFLD